MPNRDLLLTANEIYLYASLMLKFISQSLEDRLHHYGTSLTGLQFGVLRMLQYEALTISTLSQRLGQDPSAMVRIIDSLERKELVVRGVDPHDRRRNPIQTTPKGRELVAAIPIISESDPIFQALQALGVEPSAQLRDLLLKVVRQFPEGRLVSGLMPDQQNH